MRNQWSKGATALSAAILGLTLAACAQDDEEGASAGAETAGEEEEEEFDFNGVWRAINTANWNLEAHGASALDEFWQLGAFGAIPAGQGVVVGGEIPYLPEAAAQREAYRENWPASDPETACYLPGIPRATYMPYKFQIFDGDGDILFVYEYHSANRLVEMDEYKEAPVDTWMGQGNGSWDGDTLVIETHAMNGRAHLDRSGNHMSRNATVVERFSPMGPNHMSYEATITDPATFSEPWTIEMPLYRMVEENAQLLEFKCVPFAEDLLYSDLILEAQEFLDD